MKIIQNIATQVNRYSFGIQVHLLNNILWMHKEMVFICLDKQMNSTSL